MLLARKRFVRLACALAAVACVLASGIGVPSVSTARVEAVAAVHDRDLQPTVVAGRPTGDRVSPLRRLVRLPGRELLVPAREATDPFVRSAGSIHAESSHAKSATPVRYVPTRAPPVLSLS